MHDVVELEKVLRDEVKIEIQKGTLKIPVIIILFTIQFNIFLLLEIRSKKC